MVVCLDKRRSRGAIILVIDDAPASIGGQEFEYREREFEWNGAVMIAAVAVIIPAD